jgi:hypothetical protein
MNGDRAKRLEDLLEGYMHMPRQYMHDLSPPLSDQNPIDTPHPGDVLAEIMRKDAKQHGETTLDANEEAEKLMMQEAIREIISKHLYSRQDHYIPHYGQMGQDISSRLGRDAPIVDPLQGFFDKPEGGY